MTAHGTRAAIALLAVVGACATPGVPPGGPPDVAPPALLRVTPDTNGVNQRPRAVVLRFDEVISEQPRGGGGGSASGDGNALAGIVTVSPRSGAVEVDWGRERLAIRPRRGFRPNTTYTITVGPGLADVRGNALDTALVVTFATGPTLDRAQLRGVVFDWVGGKASPRAVVEAASAADTTLVFTAIAGEDGRFVIPNVPPGRYLVRGTLDVNTNRFADPREPYDTARGVAVVPAALPPAPRDTARDTTRVRLDANRASARRDTAAARPAAPVRDTLAVSLYAFARDTLRPRVTQVQAGTDSVTLRLTFDRPLLPGQRLDTTNVRLLAADSTPMRIVAVRTPAQVDSIQRARAAADSVARADSLRARGDTAQGVRARGTTPPVPTPPAGGAPREGAVPEGAMGRTPAANRPRSALGRPAARPGADGQPQRPRRPAPEPPPIDRPIPSAELVVTLAAPLRPQAAYRVQAIGVRSLNGVVGTSDRVYTTPRAERAARGEPARPASTPPAAAPRSGGAPGAPASSTPAPVATPTTPAPPAGSRPPR